MPCIASSMPITKDQQLWQSNSLNSRATAQLLRSATTADRVSTTSENNCTRRSTIAISRLTFPTSFLTLLTTLFAYLALFPTIYAIPIPGPNIHQVGLTGTLEHNNPLFPNATTTTQTSTTTKYITATIHPGISRPTNHPHPSNPSQTPLPSQNHSQPQRGQNRQIILDASHEPRVGQAGSPQPSHIQSPETQIPAPGTKRVEEETVGRAADQTGRLELKRRSDEEEKMILVELARRGFGVQSVAGDMDVKKLIEMMAGMRTKKAIKAKSGSFKKPVQRRTDIPMQNVSRTRFENPKPTPVRRAPGYVDIPLTAGRRGNRRPTQMLLSNLLIQKIPGTGFGGMAAMPNGSV